MLRRHDLGLLGTIDAYEISVRRAGVNTAAGAQREGEMMNSRLPGGLQPGFPASYIVGF